MLSCETLPAERLIHLGLGLLRAAPGELCARQGLGRAKQVCILFAWGGQHAEILEKPDRPLRCPYLPTYLPTLLMGN